MKRFPLMIILLVPVFIPFIVFGATFDASREITITEPVADNAYLIGLDVTVTNTTGADLGVLGGTIGVSAPVVGDAFMLGGVVSLDAPIQGDARIVGGEISIDDSIQGDLVLLGASITISSTPASVVALASNIDLMQGATDDVSLYAINATLAGDFAGNVHVVTSEGLQFEDGTVIHGSLIYNGPEEITLPETVTVEGDVVYAGSNRYLPTHEEAKTMAFFGSLVFHLVQFISLVLIAVLLMVVFRHTTDELCRRSLSRKNEQWLKALALGGAVISLVPLVLFICLLTIIGIPLALIGFLAYALLMALALPLFVLIVASLMRQYREKTHVLKISYVLLSGVLVSVVTLIPVFGGVATFLGMSVALGSVLPILSRKEESL